jgi:hypothetical protein
MENDFSQGHLPLRTTSLKIALPLNDFEKSFSRKMTTAEII